MDTFNFRSARQHLVQPDLDGAFNDGYQLNAEPAGVWVRRWAVIAWSVAAWCIGTLFIAVALFDGAYRLWRWIK